MSRMKRVARRWLVLSAAVGIVSGPGLERPAFAGTETFTGNASGVWDLAGNWSPTAIPDATTDVVFAFPPATSGDSIFLGTDLANSLTFRNNYYLTAGSLALTTGNVTVATGQVDYISSILGGSNGLSLLAANGLSGADAQAGGGTLNLLGANTYTGTTTISSGTLGILMDASLGAAANGITFNNTVAAGLTLNSTMTLGAGRTITLNGTVAPIITSTGNAVQAILGKITGSSAAGIAFANTGTFYLLNATNDFQGPLWAQNGTVSVLTLAESASANGNIRLGNGGSAGIFQWNTAATGPLVLNNRAIEMVGTTGGGTIDSSSAVAANSITVNTNLQVSGVGAKTLTLTGSNAGTNTFAGTITDSSGGATGLTKNGPDLWVLTNAANTFSGTLTLTQGILRLTSAAAAGSGNLSINANNGEGLELRADGSTTLNRSMTNNNSTGSAFFYFDHAIGGTAVNATVTIGTIAQANNTAGLTFLADHGYGVTTGIHTVKGASGYTITNDLGAPGYVAAGFTNGILTIAGFTTDATAGTATQTLAGWGDYVVGGITSPTAGTLFNLTKTGAGLLTFSTTNAGWTQGTLALTGGTTRLLGAAPIGTASLSLTGGLVELRDDVNTTFVTNITNVSSSNATLVGDHTIGGSGSGDLFTFGTLAGNNSVTLNLVADRGNAFKFGTTTITGAKAFTIANFTAAPGYGAAGYTPGSVTLSGVTTDATAGAATLVLSGFGDFNGFDGVTNTITSPTAATTLNLTKSNLGVVTFSGNNSGWTATVQGVLNTTLGTTRILATNPAAIGSANLALSGGLLEIRSDTAINYAAKTLTLQTGAATLVAAPLIGDNVTGNTLTIGTLSTTQASTFSFDTNHNYGITFNAATGTAVNTTIANIGTGLITFAGGLTSTAATTTWTLSGNGDFTSGAITDGTGKTALIKFGGGTVTLGTADNFTGGITLNTGILRVTNAAALAGTAAGALILQGNQPSTAGLDIRLDASADLSSRPLGRAYGTVINVDQAVGGTGANNTITLGGGLSIQDNGWSVAFTGAHGYSLKFAGTGSVNIGAAGGGVATTTWNYLTAGSGNLEFANGITFVNTAGTGTLTLGGTGDYLVSGALAYTTGGTADTVTKSGAGLVVLSGNNATSFNNAAAIVTMTNGVTRVTTSNSLGGALTTVNLNGGALDLRNDAGETVLPLVTVGGTSVINVDRLTAAGAGGTQTLGGGLKIGANTVFFTGGTNSGAAAYGLNTGLLTLTGAPTLINNLSNGGVLTIASIAGAQNITFNGGSNTNVTGGLALGTIAKSGNGTVTFSGNNANVTGNVTINAGTLALDYSGGAAANILTSTDTLTFAGGTLSMKGLAAGASQALGNVTVNAGGGRIVINPNGGATTLTLGTLAATAAGGSLLINSPANASVVLGTDLSTTLNGRTVFNDGAGNFNWATNTGASTTTTAFAGYASLAAAASTDNALQTDSGSVAAAQTVNSLKLTTTQAAQSLSLGGNLTLTNGGLLFTGPNDYTVSSGSAAVGLKSATATNSDLIISQYAAGKLTINAPVLQGTGTSTLTVAGTGTVVLGGALGANLNTYTGTTFLNGGTLQVANATRLGTTNNQALTINGGTFDLNGNSFNIGVLTGGAAAVIDNSSAAPVTFTIGNNNATGTYTGVIKNTGGALSLVKTGTGAVTLGDVTGSSSFTFTGDLTINGNSILSMSGIADAAGSKINLGTATAADNPTFRFIGSSNVTLANRQFDLSGASNGVIDGSGVVGTNGTPAVLTITSNLLVDGAGNKTLTLQGSAGNVANGAVVSGITGSGNVSVINTFAGNITNPAGGALALTVAGAGGWALAGSNSFTGGVTLSSTGLVRATTATAFGGAANTINVTGTPVLDLRSDTSLNLGNAVTMNGSFTINVDRAPGGSAYGQVMNLGVLTEATTAKTLTVTNMAGLGANMNGSDPINGYGLHLAGLNLTNGTATNVNNNIGSPGAAYFALPAAGTGVAGALVIDGINLTSAVATGTHTLTFSSASNVGGVTIINGDITQVTGTNLLALVLTAGNPGQGFYTLEGQTAATNYTGGLTIGNGGNGNSNTNTTVRVTTAFGLGPAANPIKLQRGVLEIRNDSSVNFGNALTMDGTDNFNLFVGEALNGAGGHGNTFTFGSLAENTTARTLLVAGIGGSNNNSADSVILGPVTDNITGSVITNNLQQPAMLTIGNGAGAALTTAAASGAVVQTIAGSGVTVINGEILNGATATLGLTYSGTGILDLSRVTSATSGAGGYSGGLTVANGTVRVTNAFGLGTAAGPVGWTAAGTLEVRSDTNVTYNNPLNIASTGSVLSIGQLPGGTGTTGSAGVLFTFGQAVATATGGKTLTINGIGGTLASEGDSVRIQGVNVAGSGAGAAANLTSGIANNLLLPGTLTLDNVTNNGTLAGTDIFTIGGSGTTIVTGDITDSTTAGVKTGLVYSGSGFLNLTGTAATNYTGGLTISSGVLRANTVASLGGAGNVITMNGGTLELRSDTGMTSALAISLPNSSAIQVGQSPGGTGNNGGIGQLFSLGAVTTTVTAKTLTFAGIAGTGEASAASVVLGGVNANVAAQTITNNLFLPGTLTLGNVSNATATANVLTLAGQGVTNVGDVTYTGTGGSTGIVVNAGNLLVNFNSTAATNFAGTFQVIAGTARINPFTLGGNGPITASGGTLDFRTDNNLTVTNAITLDSATNNFTFNADRATGGTGVGKIITLNNVAVSGATARTYTFTSGTDYGFTVGTGLTFGITGYVVNNNSPGPLTLGAITYSAAANGTFQLGGSGPTAVGNISSSGVGTVALIFNGAGFLDLSGNNAATNPVTALTLTGNGIVKVASPTNLGAAGSTVTFAGADTLQVRANGTGNNGTVNFNNGISFSAGVAATLDVGNNGSNTGNTVAFGVLNNGLGANNSTLTVNGQNGYAASFNGATALFLPATTGQNTTIVANAPVTINGNVVNNETGFATTNFDTLFLDGDAGGTINGTIADAVGGSNVLGGATRITKNGPGIWTLAGANSPYTGPTTINLGTLRLGAANAIGTTSALTLTATGAGVTTTLDINGNNQTLAGGLTLAGTTTTSTPLVLLGNGTLTLSNATALTYNAGNSPLPALFTANGGSGGVQIGLANAIFNIGRSATNVVSAGNPFGADTIVTAPVSDAGLGFVKQGTGVLEFASAGNGNLTGPVAVQTGTLSVASLGDVAAAVSLGNGTTTGATFQWIGSTDTNFASRLFQINTTTAGDTIDASGVGAIGIANIATTGAGAKTLTLTGTSTAANAISGTIADNTGALAVTKTSTGSWTLAGNSTYTGATTASAGTLGLSGTLTTTPSITVAAPATFSETPTGVVGGAVVFNNAGTSTLAGTNSYTGATNVTAGTFTLAPTGSLGNTAITVSGLATFAAKPGSGSNSAGLTSVPAAGATLSLLGGGVFSMVDGDIGTFNVQQEGTFAGTAVSLASGTINLELRADGADLLNVSGGTTNAFTGANIINVTALGATLTLGATYNIIAANGITPAIGSANFKFANLSSSELVTVGAKTYRLTLLGVPGIEQIAITDGTVGAALTWTGQQNGTGAANPNWTTSAADVNWANSTTASVFTDGSDVTFQDLNPITTLASGTNTNVPSGSVVVQAAGVMPNSVAINNSVINYTFTNAGGGTIGIAGSTGVVKTGTAMLTLSGINTYTGTTQINGGVVQVNVNDDAGGNGPLGTGGPISFGGGTLQYTANNQVDYSSRFIATAGQLVSIDTNGQNVSYNTALASPGGTLVKLGAGTLTLNGINTFSGATTINAGTLSLGANVNGASGAILSSTITVNPGATLLLTTRTDVLGFTTGKNVLFVNGGTVLNNTAGTRDTLFNTVTMTGGTLGGTSLGDASSGAYSLNATPAVAAASDAAGNPATISANISLQVNAVFNVTRGAAVTGKAPDLLVSGPITPFGAAGTNGFTKTGNGIMTVSSAANTYKGATAVDQGTLIFATDQTLAGGLTFGAALGSTNFGTLDLTAANATFGALTGQNANATANTVTLGAGKTLTINGPVGVGTTTSTGASVNSNVTVTGGAFVAALGTGQLSAGFHNLGAVTPTGTGVTGILDLSGTTSVGITGTTNASSILLGSNTTSTAANTAADTATGTLKLSTAGPNTVSVGTITLGTSPGSGFVGIQGFITLGNSTNNFSVDTFYVGRQKSQINGTTPDSVAFSGVGGTFTLNGFAGAGAKTNLNIGYNDVAGTGTISVGKVDLSGGTFNGTLGNLNVGFTNSATSTGGGQGTFVMSAGAATADQVALAVATSTALANTTGNFTLTGGTFTVGAGGINQLGGTSNTTFGVATVNLSGTGDLELANNSVALPAATSTFNFSGGTLNNVTTYAVAGNSNLTNSGGLLRRDTAGTTTLGTLNLTGVGTSPTVLVTAGTISVAGSGITSTNNNSMVRVEGGTLAMNNTPLTAGSLFFRSGAITSVAAAGANLNSATNPLLVLRDTTVSFPVTLAGGPTGSTAGDVRFENTTGGATGGTIAGALNLGSKTRVVNVDDSAAAATDLTIFGLVSNGGVTKTGSGLLALTSPANNSFTGPTVIQTGTLALRTAVTNNIAASTSVIVGDTPAHAAAILDVSGVAGAGGFLVANNQTVSGFGTIKSTAAVPIVIGAAGTTGAGAVIAPGSGGATPVTGRITLTSGNVASPTATVLGDNANAATPLAGTYVWKLNTDHAAAGTSFVDPGGVTIRSDTSGANWDSLVVDTLTLAAANHGFTINLSNFSGGSPGADTFTGATAAGWVIAHAQDSSITNALAAQLQLNTSGFSLAASPSQLKLEGIADPNGGSDLVVSFTPVPEPTGMVLLGVAALGLSLRRRRRMPATR